MPYCINCGAQIAEEDEYCLSCGAPTRTRPSIRDWRLRRYARDDELCFGKEPRGDPLGLVEFGLFLLVVGVVYKTNTNVTSVFLNWVRRMIELEIAISPPSTLVMSAALFFSLIGFSNLLTAVMRVMIDKVWGRILQDVLTGIGFLLIAYIVRQYGQNIITWTNVLAYGAIVFGGLVMLYAILRNIF
jgi:hypothetical protein